MKGAYFLDCDEGVGVNFIDLLLDAPDISSADAAVDDGHRAVAAPS
jgi:hypothetical protein